MRIQAQSDTATISVLIGFVQILSVVSLRYGQRSKCNPGIPCAIVIDNQAEDEHRLLPSRR